DDLVADRHRAVPGTMQRDEEIAPILGRELGSRVEGEAERCGVGLIEDVGPARRVASIPAAEIGIGYRPGDRPVAGWPPVETALDDLRDVLARPVVPEPVATVDGRPEVGRSGTESDPHGVAEPGGERPALPTIEVVAIDGRPARVAFLTAVAGGSDR